MSANESKRVALLAREGKAREKLRQTLHEVGADLVLEADPVGVDVVALRTAGAQVVLVALEAAIEDGLQRLGEVLHDPAISVIFDDAELAAQRDGWSAQRWARHLSAKLHGHQDVLPPGHEEDDGDRVAQLRPGRPATPAQLHADARIEPYLSEAQDNAPALPRGDAPLVADAGTLEPDDEGLSLSDEPLLLADEPEAWQPPTRAFDAELVDGFGGPRIEREPEPEPAPRPEPPRMVEPPPLPPELPAKPQPSGLKLELAALDDVPAAPVRPQASPPPIPTALSSGIRLELESLDGVPAAPAPVPPSMPLPQVAQPAGETVQGAVLLFAGIGGPDAVRRILAELPAVFPRPVLLHLRLDGGRYDNLVKQLERVSPMPVQLAVAGEAAQRARVYVVPHDVAAEVDEGSVRFEAGATVPQRLIAALPATQSSVLLLSGSDPACVDVALALAAQGAYVAGQSLQGCYDPAASKALQIRGGVTGSPSDLAAGVIKHG